ncbi:MAG TPA: GMC family oxidoreductase N-terminal domain-containing protein [Actinomycetota bacterium]
MEAGRGRRRGRRPSTLEALADALVPPGHGVPGALDVGAGARAEGLLGGMPAGLRRGLAAELALLEHVPRVVRGQPFSRLDRDGREEILSRIHRLPFGMGQSLMPVEALTLLAYAGAPDVQAALGFAPGQLMPLTPPLPAPRRLPVRAHPELRPGFEAAFDVVVVGSGAGGAPVARTLAEAGWSVALVEEGTAHTREDFAGPEIERMRLLYRSGGATVTVGRPPVVVPIGRAVGGSTVGNSGTCFRTPNPVIDGWATRFGVELRPEDLLPFYEEVEKVIGVAPVPWAVMGNNGLIAHRGSAALGITGRPLLRNGDGCLGSGICVAGCPVDGKRGVHLNYLPMAVAAGAEIFARCLARRVVFRGRRAIGVEGTLLDAGGRPAGTFRLRARRGVIVAAGAPLTPGLLRRSGIRHRAVGRNLRLHPASAVVGIFDEEVRGWRGVMQSYLIDALADRGVLLEATFPPPPLGYAELGFGLSGAERAAMLARLPNMAVLGLLVSDTSSGRVRSMGPGRTPLMTYDLNRVDARRVVEGMLLAARVLFAAGATEVHPMIWGAGPLRSVAEAQACLERDWRPSALRLTAYHPMGTARMGADPLGVVDHAGRVLGAERLVVADASVFPTSLGVNPQVTIMAFATRAAHHMLADW